VRKKVKEVDTASLRREAEKIVSAIRLPQIPDREFAVEAENACDILPALQKAIDRCSASGGGRVVVPAGFFRCNGPIVLASLVELHLNTGCCIKFSPDPACYLPAVPTRWEGGDLINYSPLIYGNELHDVAITGNGVFSGGFEEWHTFRPKQKKAQERSRQFAVSHVPLEERRFGEGDYLRPAMFQVRRSTRILIDGVAFTDTAFWMLQPLYSSHITIRNVHLDSLYVNNDGIDVDSCEDVLIENSAFRNGDDAVVIKSGRDQDGLQVGKPTRRVVVRNCVFYETLHGFAVGSELSGGAEDIYVYDIRMNTVFYEAISFKSAPGRGGVIRRIHLFDIVVGEVQNHLISIVSEYGGQHYGELTTAYEKFEIFNIRCHHARCGFVLQGSREHPLEKIFLENIVIEQADELFSGVGNTGDLQFCNVTANGRTLDVPPDEP